MSDWCAGWYLLAGRAAHYPSKGRLRVALLLSGRSVSVTTRHNREKLRPRVPAHALENRPIVNLISVPVVSRYRILDCLRRKVPDKNRSLIHRAGNLVDDILDGVAVTQAATPIDVTTKEQYFVNDQRQIWVLFLPMLIDGVQLLSCEFPNHNRLDLLSLSNLLEISPNEVQRVRVKRHSEQHKPCWHRSPRLSGFIHYELRSKSIAILNLSPARGD